MSEHVDHPVSRAGLVRPSRVSRTGGEPTPMAARGPSWTRTSRGFYLDPGVDRSRPEQRVLDASMVLRNGTAITGWAALRWRGGRWFDGRTPGGAEKPVTLLVGTRDVDNQPQHGIVVSGESVGPRMYDVIDGVPVTRPTWAVSFEMRYARSEFEAAKVLSLAAYDDLVSIEEMTDFLAGQKSWTGIPQARKALTWAEENVWSPSEHDLGVHLYVERSHARPVFNRPVFDLAGRHLLTPDLLDPDAGVAFEHNGPTHRESTAYGNDLDRWGLYAEHGLEAVASCSEDLRDQRRLDQRIREAYRRAGQRPRSERTWTLDLPDRWTPTHTVDLRRALSPEQRSHLLRYRAA